jgi:hypothetical protein
VAWWSVPRGSRRAGCPHDRPVPGSRAGPGGANGIEQVAYLVTEQVVTVDEIAGPGPRRRVGLEPGERFAARAPRRRGSTAWTRTFNHCLRAPSTAQGYPFLMLNRASGSAGTRPPRSRTAGLPRAPGAFMRALRTGRDEGACRCPGRQPVRSRQALERQRRTSRPPHHNPAIANNASAGIAPLSRSQMPIVPPLRRRGASCRLADGYDRARSDEHPYIMSTPIYGRFVLIGRSRETPARSRACSPSGSARRPTACPGAV